MIEVLKSNSSYPILSYHVANQIQVYTSKCFAKRKLILKYFYNINCICNTKQNIKLMLYICLTVKKIDAPYMFFQFGNTVSMQLL